MTSYPKDTIADLRTMLQLGAERAWQPPIVPTVATTGEGIADALEAVESHRRFLEESSGLEAGRRLRRRGD